MHWELSHRADSRALQLANRHYNRQKPHTPQFVAPGKCLVLYCEAPALWVSSFPRYARHAWKGAWVCTHFRNESDIKSSLLIKEAIAITRYFWGEPPPLGMITFINPTKIKPTQKPGWCFRKAGFREVGLTKIHHLLVLQLTPDDMPQPHPPKSYQLFLPL